MLFKSKPKSDDLKVTSVQSTSKNRLRAESALTSLGRRFIKDQNGNIAIMFGLGSFMMFILTGLAVDYARFNLIRTDLRNAMDAAGLAMAQYSQLNEDASNSDLIDFGRQMFFENFNYEHNIDNLNVNFTITSTTIEPMVTGTLDAVLLRDYHVGSSSFEFDNFNMAAGTEITKRGSGRVEIALVLDVTGSMRHPAVTNGSGSRIDDLKASVDVMLGALYGTDQTNENVRMSVVPFNAHVNVGGGTDQFDDDWVDMDAEAVYHGSRFIHLEEPTSIDTSSNARKTNSFGNGGFGPDNSPGLAQVFDVDRKVNHLDLFNSVNGTDWQGCVEDRPYPLDELDTPTGVSTNNSTISAALAASPDFGSSPTDVESDVKDAFSNRPNLSLNINEIGDVANSRFVPMFAPDETDCDFTSNCIGSSSLGFGYGSNTFTIGGFNRNRTISLSNWTNSPAGTGLNDDGQNNEFVDDDDFARNTQTQNRFYYNEFLLGINHALRSDLNFNSDSYWGRLKTRLNDLQVTDESVINSILGLGLEGTDHEHIARTAYVGYYDSDTKTYSRRYDQDNVGFSIDDNDTDNFTRGPNQQCPSVAIVPLTDKRSDIRDAVQALNPHGFTNSAIGTMWGWRTLSPSAPFAEGVAYDDGQWQKAVVIMTDGVNEILPTGTHWGSANTAYGFAREERMGAGIDDTIKMRDEIDNKMLRICQRMKDEGILVYTIIFALNGNQQVSDLYKACATEPNAPYFHDATTGSDLEEAFGDIASDLVDLHISR